MILTASQMQEAERGAFQQGVEAAALMEQAGIGIARAVQQFFPTPRAAIAYCGKGNNAGDALVAARVLAEAGWKIFVRLTFLKNEMTLLTQSHLQYLEERHQAIVLEKNVEKVSDTFPRSCIVLDGLLGIGAAGAPRGLLKDAIEEIKMLRREQNAFVVGIDLPSGLDATTGIPSESCVEADLTTTIAFGKTGLVADSATNYVGRLAVIPLPQLQPKEKEDAVLILPEALSKLLPRRSFDVHKGTFGRVGILAGSRGYLGAARLASAASLHAGAGMVTLYAVPDVYELLAASVIPEVMVKPIKNYSALFSERLDALAIGPGLGSERHDEILELIEKMPIPCVVDADALNALSQERSSLLESQSTLSQEMPRLLKCQGARLLTPHPGEMERLFPAHGRLRAAWARDFVESYPVTLCLKGARTIIAERGEPLFYNTTGNPGMSSAGMGDVLTGVTAAFLAQGHTCRAAAQLGTWLCGRSAEIAIFQGSCSSESLIASDVMSHLGKAMESMRGIAS